jgi:hypothetical protein
MSVFCRFFPCDERTVEYLLQTGREEADVRRIDAYLRANRMMIDYTKTDDRIKYSQVNVLQLLPQQTRRRSHSTYPQLSHACLAPNGRRTVCACAMSVMSSSLV